ncbi:MAG: hypothetical protein HQ591_02985 [candidate division Zixibacteria bacterium]|nr:hypothetical protein [Candidatus Tariuqbacter arcticus]
MVAGVIFIAVFWLLHLVISLPILVIGKKKWAPLWYLLSNMVGIYLLCAWPAFCVIIAKHFSNQPSVNNGWIYFVITAIFGFLVTVFSIRTQLPDKKLEPNELVDNIDEFVSKYIEVVKFRNFLILIATISFFVFLAWPLLALILYGWFLNCIF